MVAAALSYTSERKAERLEKLQNILFTMQVSTASVPKNCSSTAKGSIRETGHRSCVLDCLINTERLLTNHLGASEYFQRTENIAGVKVIPSAQ